MAFLCGRTHSHCSSFDLLSPLAQYGPRLCISFMFGLAAWAAACAGFLGGTSAALWAPHFDVTVSADLGGLGDDRGAHADSPWDEGGVRVHGAHSSVDYTIMDKMDTGALLFQEETEVEANPSPWLQGWHTLMETFGGWFDESLAIDMALGMVAHQIQMRANPRFTRWAQGPLWTLAAGVPGYQGQVVEETSPTNFHQWALSVCQYLWDCFQREFDAGNIEGEPEGEELDVLSLVSGGGSGSSGSRDVALMPDNACMAEQWVRMAGRNYVRREALNRLHGELRPCETRVQRLAREVLEVLPSILDRADNDGAGRLC